MNVIANNCPPLVASLDDALHEIFGFGDFREGQREVVEAVVAGQDTLVVMPTGSGKSLCFQLPACVIDGITLVVSPLIALMKDQLDALLEFGIPATFINSSIGLEEQRSRLREIVAGRYKVVYVAPERFRNQGFLDAIARVRVGLFAIDEAHCISQWGHDFRPDYLTLGHARTLLGCPTTVALTATATPNVQQDILRQLSLPDANVVVSGFARPNLFFEVFHARRREDKRHRIRALLNHYSGESAVIYCATRKQVEEVAADLKQGGIEAGVYHGGLGDAERVYVQDAFMDSDQPVLVATNAFGMGVDKSDVRAIIHYNMPGSIEAYYQEAGRAGRDGEPSHCLMLYNYADRGIHDFFIGNSNPTAQTVQRLWEALAKHGVGTHALSTDQLAQHLSRGKNAERVHPMAVEAALRQLRSAGHIDYGYRDGYPWLQVVDQARVRDLRIDFEGLQRRRDAEERHLLDVLSYASGQSCRQQFLLRYFSSKKSAEKTCGNCEICSGRPEYALKASASSGTTSAGADRIHSLDPPELLVRKLLSGVARARGKWGAHNVAGMLRGSAAKKITAAGLDKLSTFGVLSYLRQQDVVDLLDLCQRCRLTTQNVHACVSLTDEGAEVMMGTRPMPDALQQQLAMRLSFGAQSPTRPTSSSTSTSAPRAPTISAEGASSDTYERTLDMVRQGMDYDEIAKERGLTSASVLRHFMVLANDGHAIDLEGHLDGQILPMLRDAAQDWVFGAPLAPLKERMPASCTYDALKIHLVQILMERQ